MCKGVDNLKIDQKQTLQGVLNDELLDAALNGNVNAINDTVARGATVDTQDKTGNTPLIRASFYGHGQAVLALIAHGANLDIKNNHGFSALTCAVMKNHMAIVEQILANKADINTECLEARTPVVYAAKLEHYEVLKLLLKSDANHMLDDKSGKNVVNYLYENCQDFDLLESIFAIIKTKKFKKRCKKRTVKKK